MSKDEMLEIFEHNWTCLKNQAYTDNELDEALEKGIDELRGKVNNCDGCHYLSQREFNEECKYCCRGKTDRYYSEDEYQREIMEYGND